MDEKIKALLVGVNLNDDPDFENALKELESLAEACDMEVVGVETQNVSQINTGVYVGTGKVDEIKAVAHMLNADVVIFDNTLFSYAAAESEGYYRETDSGPDESDSADFFFQSADKGGENPGGNRQAAVRTSETDRHGRGAEPSGRNQRRHVKPGCRRDEAGAG